MLSSSTSAVAKLEPFLLLAKSARGAAAARLISEVTAAPGCYVFSELFHFDGIKDLAQSEQYQAEYHLLELFAFGDLTQYHASSPGTFPTLTANHVNKLRHLTLVSFASRNRVLSYKTLINNLDLVDSTAGGPSSHLSARQIRALEDVIIDSIYAGILTARLDQRKQRVEVDSVMGRDLKGAEEIAQLSQSLEEWSNTTTELLSTLASRIEQARQSDEDKLGERMAQEGHMRSALVQIANAPAGSGGGTMKSVYDRMGSDRIQGDAEMEDDISSLKKKKTSTGGPMRSKRSRA